VIPGLCELAERIGGNALLAPLVYAGLFTAMVMLIQAVSQWFDDRNL